MRSWLFLNETWESNQINTRVNLQVCACYANFGYRGEVPEWSNGLAWNASMLETASRVRIPVSPPFKFVLCI